MKNPPAISDILKEARELVSTADKWIKGAYAKDEFGNIVGPRPRLPADSAITCFCAEGAIRYVCSVYLVSTAKPIAAMVAVVRTYAGKSSLPEFNDHLSVDHPAILKLFDAAIEDSEVSEDYAGYLV